MTKPYKIDENIDELQKHLDETPYFSFDGQVHLAKILRCYDGDTLYCVFRHDKKYWKFKIRMHGYNSPELKPRKKNYADEEERQTIKHNAKLAKKRLEQLVLGKDVFLFCHTFGDFGRILGTILINPDDEKTVNQLMIEEGHGVEFRGGPYKLEDLRKFTYKKKLLSKIKYYFTRNKNKNDDKNDESISENDSNDDSNNDAESNSLNNSIIDANKEN